MRFHGRTAALAGLIGLGAAIAGPANAQELVIGTFGGSFADDTKTCHAAVFEKQTGAKLAMKLGSSVQHAAAVRATKGNPDLSVVYVDDSLATQLRNEGLLEAIDKAKLTNAADVAPQMFDKDGRFVVFMTGATVIAYDPKKVSPPPTSWNDLFDPKYAGKMALGDITGTSGLHTLLAVNKLKGGTLENLGPGFEAMKAIKPNAVTLYTQADQIVSLFERGEIVMAPWYPDRAGSAIDKGLSIAVAYPKEGAVGIRPALAIPKGAPNQELALKYIDVVLSPDGQACFADKKYAGPVNLKVKLSDKVAKIVPYGESFEKLWFVDPETVAKNLADWTRRWQREVAR
jgi:putative spermidine/putrescine transport system substrate-binding protein